MVYAVIMAGGIGSRFWPESRADKPKQFLKLLNERTLIQNTYERISGYIPPEQILVITNDQHTSLVKEQLPDLPDENIIGEPRPRNTAPCIAMAASLLLEKDEESTMVVLPADHYIHDTSDYIHVLKAGVSKAQNSDSLITIGIQPNRPETGYGYIQFNDSEFEKIQDRQVHQVRTFAEKPDLDTAARFLESGDFLWNSGMFIWKSEAILKQINELLPELYKECDQLRQMVRAKQTGKGIEDFYQNCPSISIDYGIMEHAERVYVIPARFGWSDVGSWMAVYEQNEKDEQGNVVVQGHCKLIETQNSFVSTKSDKLVGMIGLQGVALIETDDAILICRLDASQKVKTLVEQLENSGLDEYQ